MKVRELLYAGWAVLLLTCWAGSASARVCLGDTDLNGQYGFIATRAVSLTSLSGIFIGSQGTGTGTTTGTTAAVGNANFAGVGGLFTAAGNGVPFSTTGTLVADGNGALFLSPTAANPFVATQVGTYQVNLDCTVSLTLNSSAVTSGTTATGTTGSTGTTTGTTAGISYAGVLVNGGNELDLVQTSAPGGTELRLAKTLLPGNTCDNTTLEGSFGLVGIATRPVASSTTSTGATGSTGSTGGTGLGTGIPCTPGNIVPGCVIDTGGTGSTGSTGSTGATTPQFSPLVGQLNADGAGNFIPNTGISGTTAGQLSGTYQVNPDCTGTATLNLPGASGTTQSQTLSFVLTREPNGTSSSPVLNFAFTSPVTIGSGQALPN